MRNSKLLQVVGNLGTSSDIRLVLEGRDENSCREKRNKDDLMGNKNLKMKNNPHEIAFQKLYEVCSNKIAETPTRNILLLFFSCFLKSKAVNLVSFFFFQTY